MPVQVAAYPQAIPEFTSKIDLIDVVFAAHINQLQLEVSALAAALGTLPAGSAASVKARIAAVESIATTVQGYFGVGGVLAQSRVTGLSAALASLTNTTTMLQTLLSGETASRIAGDNSLLSSLNAATAAEITARSNAVSAEATARASAVTGEATARSSADTALGGRIDNLPLGLLTTLSIGSTQDITAALALLRDSVSGAVITKTVGLAAHRFYLAIFTPTAIVDMEAAGGGTVAAVHLRPGYQAGASISNVATMTSLGEVRTAITSTSSSSQDEPSGASLHQIFEVPSSGNYTFGVSAYTSRTGWRARLLSAGNDGDQVTALASPGYLTILDVGAGI